MLAAVLVSSALATAQGRVGSIRGTVTDKDFKAPVPSATVSISGTDLKVKTDEQGNYVFRNLKPGRYTLTFAKDGYVRQVRADVVVDAGQLKDVDVALSGAFTEMQEYVVQDLLQLGSTGQEALLGLRFKSKKFLNSIGAKEMGLAGASNPADALRLVAGATVKDGKSAVIRGLPDRYVSSKLNGVVLPSTDEDKRAVDLDQFPSAFVDSVQVTKTFTPDQQGSASGGAVDIRLKGVPDEPFFFKWRLQGVYNDQVTGRRNFLTYKGGGVSATGKDDGRRAIQYDRLGDNWLGAVGVDEQQAPTDYKFEAASGGMFEVGDGAKLGGFGSVFYEHDSSLYDNGVSDSYWVEKPGASLTPKKFQEHGAGDFKTNLFDVTQGTQSVKWGLLGSLGFKTENHKINLFAMRTQIAEDKATLAEDTRGKRYFFPEYDVHDRTTPGHAEVDTAPYLRLQTLEYTERTTDSLQLHGDHVLGDEFLGFKRPKLDWFVARSWAGLDQPDKRQFGSLWLPGRAVGSFPVPPTYIPYKPDANFTLGNLQRIWKTIDEDSDQYAANLKLPFKQWNDKDGAFTVGYFDDHLRREYNQDSFSNFNDNSGFNGRWEQRWSNSFPLGNHPITASTYDVDYSGKLNVNAYYAMLDLPLLSNLDLTGGLRVESTEIGVVNHPEEDAVWYPPGSVAETKLEPGDADVDFKQTDQLPSLGLIYEPVPDLTLRAAYSETIARQTFKELSPIIQQEFLGGPIFIGNPELQMSSLRNYDLRADYTPFNNSLLSVSWFRKDIEDAIEYVQVVAAFDYTTAVNYPKGKLTGWEFEARQGMGELWSPLQGLTLGGNLTLIDSEVTLPEKEAARLRSPEVQAPMDTRDATGAPDRLYNLFATYDVPGIGTRLGAFYTVTGDTLVAGASESKGNYVPNVYATQYDTFNVSLVQPLGDVFFLSFQGKNLTNPNIKTVYRSPFTGPDLVKTSFSKGREFTFAIGGQIRF